jgi:hypothetical protein
MPQSQDLMGVGEAWPLAALLGNDPQLLAAAGTTQATAALINNHSVEMTATGADGIILPLAHIGSPFYIFNSSASTGLLYVPVGHTLNTTLNGSLSIATHKAVIIWQYKLKFWATILTA